MVMRSVPALYLIDIVIEFLLTRKVNGVPIFEPGICGILGVCNKVAEDLVLIGLIIGIQLDDRVFIVIIFIGTVIFQRTEP